MLTKSRICGTLILENTSTGGGEMIFRDLLLLLLLLILIDLAVIPALRSFLWDFLMIRRNKQGMKRNLSLQTKWDRITLNYIGVQLTQHQCAFQFWHGIYLAVIYSILPQYLLVGIALLFFDTIAAYIIGFFVIIKTLLGLAVRLNMDSNLVSKYSKFSKRR